MFNKIVMFVAVVFCLSQGLAFAQSLPVRTLPDRKIISQPAGVAPGSVEVKKQDKNIRSAISAKLGDRKFNFGRCSDGSLFFADWLQPCYVIKGSVFCINNDENENGIPDVKMFAEGGTLYPQYVVEHKGQKIIVPTAIDFLESGEHSNLFNDLLFYGYTNTDKDGRNVFSDPGMGTCKVDFASDTESLGDPTITSVKGDCRDICDKCVIQFCDTGSLQNK